VSQHCVKHSPCHVAVVKNPSRKDKEENVDVDCTSGQGCYVVSDERSTSSDHHTIKTPAGTLLRVYQRE
jgi:hypothetical protein